MKEIHNVNRDIKDKNLAIFHNVDGYRPKSVWMTAVLSTDLAHIKTYTKTHVMALSMIRHATTKLVIISKLLHCAVSVDADQDPMCITLKAR
jgi:hypothetical protein